VTCDSHDIQRVILSLHMRTDMFVPYLDLVHVLEKSN